MTLALIAQSIPTDPPVTVAAALFMVIVALMTGLLHTKGDYDTQKARIERLEQALDLQREATTAYAEAATEMRSLGRLLRKVLEALPQADDTPAPPPTPHGRRP
jgi:hypothetical protein